DSINDYTRKLNQPDIPDDLAAILRLYGHLQATDPAGLVRAEHAVRVAPPAAPAAILRLYGHLQATDPAGFVVAEQAVDGGEPAVVAFTVSYRRETLWFLSMLFGLPDVQALGRGRGLLAQVMPPDGEAALATCTDSAQPISNALY